MYTESKIDAKTLKAGSIAIVEGLVTYSRITKMIEGDELLRDQQKKKANGMLTIDRPYTTITLKNVSIVPSAPGMPLTPTETYVAQKFYNKKNESPDVLYYTFDNKSKFLPKTYQLRQDGSHVADEIVFKGELAVDLRVRLVINVYEAKAYNSKGIGLQEILVMEPVKYYSGASANSGLAARGITINPLSEDERKKAESERNAANIPYQTMDNNPSAPAAPGSTISQPAPGTTPFMNQPMQGPPPIQAPVSNPPVPPMQQAAPIQQPAQPAYQAPTTPDTMWECPNCHKTQDKNIMYCGQCGTAQPTVNPYSAGPTAQEQAETGIRYDADNTNRNY